MRARLFMAAAALAITSPAGAAQVVAPPPPRLGPEVQPFVSVPPGQIALTHVRVIDGTGAAPMENATVLIDGPRAACCLLVRTRPAMAA